jgi:hypothetical protein
MSDSSTWTLIVDFKESLERELIDMGTGLRGEMRAGFAAVSERLDRVEATLARSAGPRAQA